MRGKADKRKAGVRRTGITPAYAGKSLEPRSRSSKKRDHPCVCGEKPVKISALRTVAGSPLRMRGKGTFFIQS